MPSRTGSTGISLRSFKTTTSDSLGPSPSSDELRRLRSVYEKQVDYQDKNLKPLQYLQLPAASSVPPTFFFPFPIPIRFSLRSTLLLARCSERPMPSPVRRPCTFNEPCLINVEAKSGLKIPDSKSTEHLSLEAPLNHRTIPLRRPTEFLSELEVESDRRARSLCLGVSVGRILVALRRRLPKGLWLMRHCSSRFSVSRRLYREREK